MKSIEIKVIPTDEMFFNEDNYFGIYRCNIDSEEKKKILGEGWKISDYGNISFKGVSPKLMLGQEYTATRKEDDKSKFKGSYILESIRQEKPITQDEQRVFLESILTENQVNNIFDIYKNGEDIIGMIEDNTFDYQSVKGLGDKTYEKLKSKILDNVGLSEVLVFLSKYGIKYNMISKLTKEYGNPQIVIQKIEENPYLLTEIKGIGFKRADMIAKAVGYDMESGHRITSCIRHVIMEENKDGHSWIEERILLNRCVDYLNISKIKIDNILMNGCKGVLNMDNRYTLDFVYKAEEDIAQKLIQMKSQSKKMFKTEEIDVFLDTYCEKHNVVLEEEQRQFFYDFNERNIMLLIGSGGVGKSWLQKILLELIEKKNYRTALLAPTGRASRVMSDYTGKTAFTIHRKIGIFDNDEDANGVIDEDIIIVDESSMCDVLVMQKLLNSIVNYGAKIIFVGDDFQLPSVGVGNFLYDAINSGVIHVAKLNKVFRHEDDGIANVATNIRNGVRFLNNHDNGRIRFGKDCMFHMTDKEYMVDGYVHYYKRVLKKYDMEDVVILSPTNKGKLGVFEINQRIQEEVNPSSPYKREKTFGRDIKITYRVGDMVMNIVNSYDVETQDGGLADVFNGDSGKILDVDESEKVIVINFNDVVVKVKFENVLNTLTHAWAITKHKSQGSQFKVVIAIVDNSSKYQLNANLVYTGVSRAREYLLVLGQAEAINHAIKKFANMERRSFLLELLLKYNNMN